MMAKRKETRSVCTYAIRNKTAGTRTELYLIDFDGEAQDMADFIKDHADFTLGPDALGDQTKKFMEDAGFLCRNVTVVVVSEKNDKKS